MNAKYLVYHICQDLKSVCGNIMFSLWFYLYRQHWKATSASYLLSKVYWVFIMCRVLYCIHIHMYVCIKKDTHTHKTRCYFKFLLFSLNFFISFLKVIVFMFCLFWLGVLYVKFPELLGDWVGFFDRWNGYSQCEFTLWL